MPNGHELIWLRRAHAGERVGIRPYTMTPAKLRLAMVAMGQPETNVSDLCAELGITCQTLYRYVGPDGELQPDEAKLFQKKRGWVTDVPLSTEAHF